jgi:RimJ/RimL family protein N-acetyltransferase
MPATSLDEIHTPRLRLTRLRESDLADLCCMYRNPRVMATLGGIRSEDETRSHLQQHLAHWDQHGFGRWAAREPATGRFIGRGGLLRLALGGREEVEVGYGLLPEFWGQGLATELAAASVRAGFEVLGLPELVSMTLPNNAASRRVMEKAGFRYEREVIHADLPHVLYRLTASAWCAGGAAPMPPRASSRG